MSAPKRLPQQIDNLATIYSYIRIVFFFIHLNIGIVDKMVAKKWVEAR